MVTVVHADQLRRDAEPRTGSSDAALNHGGDVQPAADLPDIEIAASKAERRSPRSHLQSGKPAESVDQIFRETIAEELVVRVTAPIDEGQDGDRWRRAGRTHRTGRGAGG